MYHKSTNFSLYSMCFEAIQQIYFTIENFDMNPSSLWCIYEKKTSNVKSFL